MLARDAATRACGRLRERASRRDQPVQFASFRQARQLQAGVAVAAITTHPMCRHRQSIHHRRILRHPFCRCCPTTTPYGLHAEDAEHGEQPLTTTRWLGPAMRVQIPKNRPVLRVLRRMGDALRIPGAWTAQCQSISDRLREHKKKTQVTNWWRIRVEHAARLATTDSAEIRMYRCRR